MVDAPDIPRRVPVTGSVPTVNFSAILAADRTNPGGSILVAEMLKQASTKIEDRLDIYAAEEGRREGIKQGSVSVPDLKDAATIRGRAYNDAARASVSAQFDLKGREKLDALEEAYGADAGVFVKAAEAWQNSVLANLETFDPAIALEFKTNYQLRQKAAQNRIVERQTAIARDRQMEGALRLQMSLEEEMAGLSLQLFSAEPEQAAVVLKQMTANSARLVNLANQIGPDGRPLFSARERLSFEKGAQDIVSENIGLSYLQSQSSPLQALQSLNDGSAAVRIVDENGEAQSVPLAGLIGPTAVNRARKAYIEQLRGEISFQNLLEERSERDFRQKSDALYTDLAVLAQDGALTPQIVEAARTSMEPQKYLQLRSIAKTGGPEVSDGKVLDYLTLRESQGEDVQAEALAAFEDNRITRAEFMTIVERNSKRLRTGLENPVEVGRDYLTTSLGKLSKELDIAQSMRIGPASADYNIMIEDFVLKNKRPPTAREARALADDVLKYYAVADVQKFMGTKDVPLYINRQLRDSGKMTREDVRTAAQKVADTFMKKHNNDPDKVKNDPEYQRQMDLLKEHERAIEEAMRFDVK